MGVFGIALIVLCGCVLKTDTIDDSFSELVPRSWSADVTVADLPIAASMLDLIDAPQLKALVREALKANLNLQATARRLQASRLRFKGGRSAMLPEASINFQRGRKNDIVSKDTGEQEATDYYEGHLETSWEIDLWGRLADQYAASKQDLMAQQADYRNARDSLAVKVIQAWIEQVAARRALSIQSKRVAVLQDIETMLINRYQGGIGSLDEYATAKSRTQTALADRSAQQLQWRQSIRNLEILLGRPPKGALLAGETLPEVTPAPVDTPLNVMRSRPDVQAALNRMVAARRSASAANKAMLPQLNFSYKIFRYGIKLSDLGSAKAYWDLLSTLVQPLFKGGELRNEARATRAESDAALLELQDVMLRALKEVEDALDQERELAVQLSALKSAVRESEISSQYFAERYRQGLDTIQSLLTAREQEMEVKIRLNQVTAEQLTNRIQLALALGVGLSDKPAANGDKHRYGKNF